MRAAHREWVQALAPPRQPASNNSAHPARPPPRLPLAQGRGSLLTWAWWCWLLLAGAGGGEEAEGALQVQDALRYRMTRLVSARGGRWLRCRGA